MKFKTDDLRILECKEVSTPAQLHNECPITDAAAECVFQARQGIHQILHGQDDRLLVVIGPCSIHDPISALEYANKLSVMCQSLAKDLMIVMRVYFEKPRTSVGWKGLINDPQLDGTFEINKGLRLARKLLLDLNTLGVPSGTEYLDLVTPQYISDLISWGAIGARTTESQVHRELASGLSCPVGFKNGTDGNLKIAVDAINASSRAHSFLSLTKQGHSAIFSTKGNEDCHIILRGGNTPNYDQNSTDIARKKLTAAGLTARIMVDCSHANSQKQFKKQIDVAENVAQQISAGNRHIIGVLIESHLHSGKQDLQPGKKLKYGQSITDACLGWDDSVKLLKSLSVAVQKRRQSNSS